MARKPFKQNLSISFALSLLFVTATAQNALNIPPALTGPTYNLSMDIGTTEFTTGNNTTTYGYNGAHGGPTLIMSKGDEITMNVTNNLGENTTTHWHGMHVSPANDGGPHSVIAPGETWSPSFTVLDTASTMWYHPHLHGNTNSQVTYGLAGMILVRDDIETAAGLPVNYGVDEFPLIIQDRAFDGARQLRIVALGSEMLINGTSNPYLDVPSQMVRFRVLNGSSERAYYLGMSDNRIYQVVGADGGLLEAPAGVTRVLIMPGERVDIVIDFSGQNGNTYNLISYSSEITGNDIPGSSGGPGGANPLNGVDIQLVEFRVGLQTASPVTSLPASIQTLTKYTEPEATVTRTIQMSTAGPGQPFLLDNFEFDHSVINQTVLLDTVEIWEIQNNTNLAHPFHIHDIQFYILDRDGNPPEAWETGKKDTVIARAFETVRFITKFETHADEAIPYMYHCHILTHEDGGMMAQFIVVDPATILDISTDGTNANLSWHTNLSAFTLKQSTDLATFSNFTYTPTVVNSFNTLSLPIDATRKFFRLEIP